MMLGLISAFFAIVGAAFVDGNANWPDMICAGVLAFLIAMWLANFVFPNTVRWCVSTSDFSAISSRNLLSEYVFLKWAPR